MDETFTASKMSCFKYCALISFVMLVFFGTLIFMKIMPAARR